MAARITLEPDGVVACLVAEGFDDPSQRGAYYDACLQRAAHLCKAAEQSQIAQCYEDMAAGMSRYVSQLLVVLPVSIAAEEVQGRAYLRGINRLRAAESAHESCMVPFIATVALDVRRSMCAVQDAYTRVKLALELARMVGLGAQAGAGLD